MDNNFCQDLRCCRLCPRGCGADRTQNTGNGLPHNGICGAPALPRLARAALHYWEEPCISGKAALSDQTPPAGTRGSGTVFFSCCNLGCLFCQNHAISAGGYGKTVTIERLAELFLELQAAGAYNINLVSATPYLPHVIKALQIARPRLTVPVVYNTGGYELPEALHVLAEYVDIWLTDLKFYDPALAQKLCGAPDYFDVAYAAAQEMIGHAGKPVFDQEGMLQRGVIIRHLAMPGQRADSKKLLDMLAMLPRDGFLLSLMSQYTPFYKAKQMPPFHRRISSFEYRDVVNYAEELGLTNGYMQGRSSAKEEYTPAFDLTGI